MPHDTLADMSDIRLGMVWVRSISSSFIVSRRAQSVLEISEEDFRFAPGSFSEGDDMDFIVGLSVHYGNGDGT